ncbi:MAG TPA: sigma-70 family RNA polymerase sigma factor [Candidatus Cybelea sp.]|nr:sigma-70 family RNA polymerase sigma factor [Candidatus Cybelea sp.]
MHSSPDLREVDRLFRAEATRAVATLGRVFNDFDRAEDAVQDAYALALERWPRFGVPINPAAWILLTARNKAIDRLRRERVAAEKGEILANLEALARVSDTDDEEPIDDRLAMIFAACHPALNDETRIALTLRFAAGLTVEEIAAALLALPATIAQRLVRAKHKIRRAGIAFAVPNLATLPERLQDILRVIYLIFNEGYASSTFAARFRGELCDEALHLVRVVDQLLPNQPEVAGLYALMLFHDARRATRVDSSGDTILLERQDRKLWNMAKIAHGMNVLARDRAAVCGPYRLQAMIAAEHARATSWATTDWPRIRHCYDLLYATDPSPVVGLNRAVAVAYDEGAEAGLASVDALEPHMALSEYAPLHSVRAELLRRADRADEARAAYAHAIALTKSDPERRYLSERLAGLERQTPTPEAAKL